MPLSQGFPGHNAAAAFADIRRDLEGSVVRDAAGKMRAGVFPAHFNALVTGRSDMKVAIADFRAVIDRGGAIFMANVGADTSVTLDAAPAANRRIDLIYAIQRSTTLGDAASLPIFGFVNGTASATPVAPSLPANLTTALPLATVEIPAGATTTLSAGVVITQVYPYTAMAGGTVAARNSVELNAWAPVDGSKSYLVNAAQHYERAAGGWVASGPSWKHQVLGADSAAFAGPIVSSPLIIKTGYRKIQLSGGIAVIPFDTPFPARALHFSPTPIEGTAITPAVNARDLTASQATLIFPGAGSATVAFTWVAFGF